MTGGWGKAGVRRDPVEGPETYVYVHTPHSLIGNPDRSSGDMVAIPFAEARELAAAILAAVRHAEDELSKKRGGRR